MLNAKQAAAELGIQPFGDGFATGRDWKNREESGLKMLNRATFPPLPFTLLRPRLPATHGVDELPVSRFCHASKDARTLSEYVGKGGRSSATGGKGIVGQAVAVICGGVAQPVSSPRQSSVSSITFIDRIVCFLLF